MLFKFEPGYTLSSSIQLINNPIANETNSKLDKSQTTQLIIQSNTETVINSINDH